MPTKDNDMPERMVVYCNGGPIGEIGEIRLPEVKEEMESEMPDMRQAISGQITLRVCGLRKRGSRRRAGTEDKECCKYFKHYSGYRWQYKRRYGKPVRNCRRFGGF